MKLRWIASYPKSGNTWVRMFLEGYFRGEPPSMDRISIIRSDQAKELHNIDTVGEHGPVGWAIRRLAALLRLSEIAVYPGIFKTHVPNMSVNGLAMFPEGTTEKALYVVRDPRDVAVSYAKHMGKSIEETAALMNNERTWEMGGTPHYLSSWNNHVTSWQRAGVPVAVVQYEQLREDPIKRFRQVVQWFDLPLDEDRLRKAVEWTDFDVLSKREDEEGFSERPPPSEKFFRKGKVGGWRDEVDSLPDFGDMMREFNYG